MAKHAVVRTDKMYGTDVRTGLVSIMYLVAENDEKVATEIENGNILKMGDLLDGEREIYEGSEPEGTEALEDIVLVASPELMYNEHLHDLDEFINVAGKPARAYVLHEKDIFSVTEEALDDLVDSEESPAVGKGVAIQASTKLQVVDSGDVIGKIIAKDIVGKYTYYVIQIKPETLSESGVTGDTGVTG